MDDVVNLICKLCPSRMCLYVVSEHRPLVIRCQRAALAAGVNPNEIRLSGACGDGLHCGGWGRVVMEVSTVDRSDPS